MFSVCFLWLNCYTGEAKKMLNITLCHIKLFCKIDYNIYYLSLFYEYFQTNVKWRHLTIIMLGGTKGVYVGVASNSAKYFFLYKISIIANYIVFLDSPWLLTNSNCKTIRYIVGSRPKYICILTLKYIGACVNPINIICL